jgi:hypothetical protein
VRKTGHKVDWRTSQEAKLKDAVEMQHGKKWDADTTLVAKEVGCRYHAG